MIAFSQQDVIRFFFAQGASQALLRWLEFRLFVRTLTPAGPKLTNTINPVLTDCLQAWEQQSRLAQQRFPGMGLLFVISIVLGALAMAGALNYRLAQPINIWIPLTLFAFLPLLLTLISLFLAVRKTQPSALSHYPVLLFFVRRFHLGRYMPFQTLLLRWLFWRLQALSLCFLAGALMAFFALATIQDYTFGWSSTLITDHATMANIIQLITWPWHFWFTVPDARTIQLSRFVMNIVPASFADDGWWQTLVLATLTYGVLPRLLLMLFLRQRFIRALKINIVQTGDIEQFISVQRQQHSRSAVTDPPPDAPVARVELAQLPGMRIGWHVSDQTLSLAKRLGLDGWDEDERWLQSAEARSEQAKIIVIDGMATPTGELADIIALLSGEVSLALVFKAESAARQHSQLKSWQYFAEQNQVIVQVLR